MKSINLIALKNLKKEYLQGIFSADPEDTEDDFIKYRLCENKDEDDGMVYVITSKDLPESFKKRASCALKRILSGTPHSDKKIEFINSYIPYVEDTSSC